jgi:hypothetical protein
VQDVGRLGSHPRAEALEVSGHAPESPQRTGRHGERAPAEPELARLACHGVAAKEELVAQGSGSGDPERERPSPTLQVADDVEDGARGPAELAFVEGYGDEHRVSAPDV